jgi:acyl-CoA synthetase (AMP-forming)/AMP-acid ligase II
LTSLEKTPWEVFENFSRNDVQKVLFSSIKNGITETYQKVWADVEALVAWLSTLQSERIVTNLPNSTFLAKLVLACLISGREICCLAEGSTPNETMKAISLLKPDLIVSEPSSLGTPALLGQLGSEQVFSDKVKREMVNHFSLAGKQRRDSEAFSYGSLIVFTSGSSGAPKGILLDGERLWKSAKVFSDVNGLSPQNHFWNYLPMSYLGGLFNLLLIPIAANSSIYLDKAFGPQTFLNFNATIEREGIDSIWLVPTIARGLTRIAKTTGYSKTSQLKLNNAFIGTAPSSEQERKEVGDLLGCKVLESYGLTETTFITYEAKNRLSENKIERRIYPGVETRINTEDSTLEVRSPFAFVGLLDSDGMFLKSTSEWFNTGDVCDLSTGIPKPIARIREVIKKGGLLVNLCEIEALVRERAVWGEVAAVPVEDNFYGENYVLFFETTEEDSEKTNLIKFLATNLSRSKLPIDTIGVDAIPLLRSGKPDKIKLASILMAARPDIPQDS